MQHILICDDEENIRRLIRKYAEFEGYAVDEAANGMEALTLCADNRYDAMILDIMMPELNGFSVLREIRKTSDMPILLLSARGEEYDKISGFEMGADDYVDKPFSPKLLMLRLRAVLRRSASNEEEGAPEVWSSPDLVVNFTAHTVDVDGVRADLSPKEYELLFFMVRHPNIALTRERILREVWGYDFFGDDRTLDTHIKLLRRSLGASARRIVTIRGVGYRFEEHLEAIDG